MSQPTRADRRRSSRGGDPTHPPKRRDPMVVVYIAIGVVIVLVLVGFGIFNTYGSHREGGFAAQELATPSPAPKPTQKPIDLTGVNQNTVIGTSFFQRGDSPGGGQGQLVDGIPCQAMEQAVVHYHVHLSIFNHGKQIAIPALAGGAPIQVPGQPFSVCLYWLHAHDASGIIHIEAAQAEAPDGGIYSLGTFFDIWGYTLKSDQIASFKGPVTAYVNGELYTGDLSAITFTSHKEITLEVGTPLVKPPTYTFPPGY